MRLTNKIVEAFAFAGKPTKSGFSAHYEWDDLPGFGVRIYPTGAKSFVVKYRNQFNRQRFYTIGKFPEVSTSAARKEAEIVRTKVRSGEDPSEDKSELRKQKSVADLCALYMDLHSKPNKKTWKQDDERITRHINYRWGKMAVGELTRRQVQKGIIEIKEGKNLKANLKNREAKGGPIEANYVMGLLGSIYRWGIDQEYIPFMRVPSTGIKKFKKNVCERYVSREEMPWLLRELDTIENEAARNAIKFVLYTGCRPSEAMKLEWSDVNPSTNSVTFRDTKNGTDHRIPLTRSAMATIEEMPRINDFVFPGVNGRISTLQFWFKPAMERAQQKALRAGIEINVSEVNSKDLRTTVATWLASSDYSVLTIAAILNHKKGGVTGRHYAKVSDEPIRLALEDLATQYQSTLIEDSNVIPFSRSGKGK